MRRFAAFVRAHPLWVAFASTLVPLVVLLGLQYRWLVRLETMSAKAHRAALDGGLEAIGSEVRYFYLSNAERALNLPASMLLEGRRQDAATFWEHKPVEGVRRLFLVDFTHVVFGNYWALDPGSHELVPLEADPEGLAIVVAVTPWQLFRARNGKIPERNGFEVNERDPEHRLILNPIADDAGNLVGMAGMVLDEEYLRNSLLPTVIDQVLEQYFPNAARSDLAVAVHDASGTPMLTHGTQASGNQVERHLPFVFTDWTLELRSLSAGPERWARASFVSNMALALLLAAVLAGAVALALRAADRSMRLSRMKSDFVSNVSHELRTPLASIRVFAEFLRLGRVQSPEKVCEYGEYIDAESQRLTRLIDNILDFSRIESGRKVYRFEEADLQQIVEATLHTFSLRLQHSGFQIQFVPPKEPLPRVRLDSDAIGQALHNLLDNAVKYSDTAREVTVSLDRVGNDVVLAVRDHGIGIARREQGKVFERFHRAGTSLVHDVKGSGLGLSIVQHIVAAHAGRVSVESELNAGSTFSIHLPVPVTPNRVEAACRVS